MYGQKLFLPTNLTKLSNSTNTHITFKEQHFKNQMQFTKKIHKHRSHPK